MENFAVIGAGAWGTALACIFAKAGCSVSLWAFENETAESLKNKKENTAFLPGIQVPETIKIYHDLSASVKDAECIVVVTPTQFTRSTLMPLCGKISKNVPIIIAAKGIEIKSGKLLSVIVSEMFPENPVGILTGPTFAIEAAKEMPTAITLALDERFKEIGKSIVSAIAYKSFRPYMSFDVIGAEIGGAVKNVIAVACGVAAGLELGDNARAALITRGLAEIMRLGIAMGAKKDTFAGLSGLGDLTLTCSAMQSRNFSLGYRIGKGEKPSDILQSRNSVSEGAYTAEAAVVMAEKHGVEMPICTIVNNLIKETCTATDAISALMNRPLQCE